jgi:molybdenum cofactor cytidylyltransferase
MSGTAVIILAAGNSSRLGVPKQTLWYDGQSLVRRVAGEAHSAKLNPVIVVTGAYSPEVSAELADCDVHLVYNEHWQKGMGSGIVAGLSKLLAMDSDVENAIIAVCDQPYVSAQLFGQLVEKAAESGRGMVACAYADTLGTPVLFGQQYFGALLQLNGNEGAKKLLKLYHADVAGISFPQGSIDIDTAEDYEELKKGRL